jgi:hypothetical protein
MRTAATPSTDVNYRPDEHTTGEILAAEARLHLGTERAVRPRQSNGVCERQRRLAKQRLRQLTSLEMVPAMVTGSLS